jgi:hypothetical protein
MCATLRELLGIAMVVIHAADEWVCQQSRDWSLEEIVMMTDSYAPAREVLQKVNCLISLCGINAAVALPPESETLHCHLRISKVTRSQHRESPLMHRIVQECMGFTPRFGYTSVKRRISKRDSTIICKEGQTKAIVSSATTRRVSLMTCQMRRIALRERRDFGQSFGLHATSSKAHAVDLSGKTVEINI